MGPFGPSWPNRHRLRPFLASSHHQTPPGPNGPKSYHKGPFHLTLDQSLLKDVDLSLLGLDLLGNLAPVLSSLLTLAAGIPSLQGGDLSVQHGNVSFDGSSSGTLGCALLRVSMGQNGGQGGLRSPRGP
jgi:hypothetical protein